MNETKPKLVVIGNGMAGARVVEEILKRAPGQFDIAMFGAEPYGNYNRILLSNVLNGSQTATEIFMNPLAWYGDNGITLYAGVKATLIDRERKLVLGTPLKKDALAYAADAAAAPDTALVIAPYDYVIIATGSRPFVPPMEGGAGPGTFLFRTIDDCSRIAEYAKTCKEAAVNRCLHRQGALAEGLVGDGKVVCPLHAHKFDLASGVGSELHECVQAYFVECCDGDIWLTY